MKFRKKTFFKKILSLSLVIMSLFTFASCDSNVEVSQSTQDESEVPQVKVDPINDNFRTF